MICSVEYQLALYYERELNRDHPVISSNRQKRVTRNDFSNHSSKLGTNCFNRRVDVSLGIENMRRDATSVEPSFLGDLDYYSVFFEQCIAESPTVDRVGKLERHKRRRERPRRRTDNLNP